MPEKKKTEAQIRAQKKYMENFVEIKVRMTADKRSIVQEHAASMGESATAFINRAIDETMDRDRYKGKTFVLSHEERTPESPIKLILEKKDH